MNDSVEQQLKTIGAAIDKGEYKRASSSLRIITSNIKEDKELLSEATLLLGKIADNKSEYSSALDFYKHALREALSCN